MNTSKPSAVVSSHSLQTGTPPALDRVLKSPGGQSVPLDSELVKTLEHIRQDISELTTLVEILAAKSKNTDSMIADILKLNS
jgi:hypothetical protein